MSKCKKCLKELNPDEIGLTKKLINRGTKEFYCIDCLAEKFECSTDLLEEKIQQFRNMGCTLFV